MTAARFYPREQTLPVRSFPASGMSLRPVRPPRSAFTCGDPASKRRSFRKARRPVTQRAATVSFFGGYLTRIITRRRIMTFTDPVTEPSSAAAIVDATLAITYGDA